MREMASRKSSSWGKNTIRKWSVVFQLKPVPCTNMTLVFRKSRAASNLIFLVQSSNDLKTWTDLTDATNAALALPPLLSDDISDSYKVSVPLVGNKQFMRLKVINP